MVRLVSFFNHLLLFVYPIEVVNTLRRRTYSARNTSTINSNRRYLTLCVRSAFGTLAPVNIWFSHIFKSVTALRAAKEP
jgi:hypothetical protein